MNTELLIDEIVSALARSPREKEILPELLHSLVKVAVAEHVAVDQELNTDVSREDLAKLLEQVR